MRKGAFQTSRNIFENPIWNDIPKFRIFFYIYGNAVFSKEGSVVGGIKLKRGQFLRSYRNLQDDLQYLENRSIKKYSLSVIKRKIDSLVDENRLKIEDTELGTLFTVINYEQYQGLGNYRTDNLERRKNADGTQMERSWNNNNNVKTVNNDIEEEERAREENPFVLFEENICRLSTLNIDGLNQWCDDLGDELVSAAIKLAAKYNARTFAYVEDIFIEWYKNGIKTVEDARSYVRDKNSRNNTIPFRRKQETNDVQAILDKFREV